METWQHTLRTEADPGRTTGKTESGVADRRCASSVRGRLCRSTTKDTDLLRRFMTDRGKIKARANTGTCRQHQRDVALAIKTARELAMLPYLTRTLVADKSASRRGRDAGRPADRPPGIDDAAPPPTGESEAARGHSRRGGHRAGCIADVSADDAVALPAPRPVETSMVADTWRSSASRRERRRLSAAGDPREVQQSPIQLRLGSHCGGGHAC